MKQATPAVSPAANAAPKDPQLPRKKIALALQGGGAHGAFTWGVLDHILEDGRLDIEAISGASAGAMNAVAMLDGFKEGGPAGARRQLKSFWKAVSYDSNWSPAQRNVLGALMDPFGITTNVVSFWSDWFQQTLSPAEFNPLDINPLADILESQIDFERMRNCDSHKLFISATNVESGKIKIFERREITAKHVMASACLPTLFRTVEIDGQPYWDGGYMGNPALYPLFYGIETSDILLVQVNPIRRKGVPKDAHEIQRRLNEITFNATLLREFRAVEFVTRLVDQGVLPNDRYKRINMHRIEPGELFEAETGNGKLNAGWDGLKRWRDAGRKAAKRFLTAHFDDIGIAGTFDLKAEL
ncbi:MAG: patatin-like phospholipase family protein [Bosea sp. (in: a-proteobacteria)]